MKKRLIALIFVINLVFILTSCGGNSNTPTTSVSTSTPEAITSEPATANSNSDVAPIVSDTENDDGLSSDIVMPDGGSFEGDMNGYGTWKYANYTYEGELLNGIPNGEGTLSLISAVDGELVITIKSTWIDGYADGEITYVQGNNAPAVFPVSRGVPAVTQPTNAGSIGVALSEEDLIGVPPWVAIQSSGSLILQ